jgi:hypothetical protein
MVGNGLVEGIGLISLGRGKGGVVVVQDDRNGMRCVLGRGRRVR